MSLRCENLDVAIGASAVLRDLSLAVQPGLNVLVGANGSGKTTLLRALAGLQRCSRGEIRMGDDDITDMLPHVRRRLGLIYREQTPVRAPTIAAVDYLQLACDNLPVDRIVRQACELGFPESLALAVARPRQIATMTLRDRRILELLTLAGGGSQVILLDEPLANAGSDAVDVFGPFFEGLACRTPLLMVEHRKEFFAWVAGRKATGSFIEAGSIVLREREMTELLADPRVVGAYGRMT